MPQDDFDPSYVDAVATKFAVLGEIFAALGNRAAVVDLMNIIDNNDEAGFGKFLDGFDVKRIPTFSPSTPCFVVSDFVIEVFDFGPGVHPVMVLREPIGIRQMSRVWSCQQKTGGTMRQASVLASGSLTPTTRTIAEGEDFIACLEKRGLVEPGEEQVMSQPIKIRTPNGEKLRLCPFLERPR